VIEMADWESVDGMLRIKNITPATVGADEYKKKREYFASRAIGGHPFVGSPDHVAEELAALSRGGIRGVAFSMINWLDELPLFCDEVLPRLERMGVRQAAA
jgi:alkanesulfonate monooxygenase SsuD/methylene tetrahydromethanopterin reductase-like flavin-dependent oxidoreductase (luciferase family)